MEEINEKTILKIFKIFKNIKFKKTLYYLVSDKILCLYFKYIFTYV